jgi:hypothetical protein
LRRRPVERRALQLATLALALAAGLRPAHAQPLPVAQVVPVNTGVAWSELGPEQARALAPLVGIWSSLDPAQQRKWLELGARYPTLSAGDQKRLQDRMREWAAMTPQERVRARVQFQQASQLSAEERLQRWQAYQALTPDERQRLAAPAGGPTAAPPRDPAAGGAKTTVVAPPPAAPPRPVAPATVQAAPGATTRPMTRVDVPPRHQQPGLPKLPATPDFVDQSTLLPRRGAQAAPVRDPTAPAASAAR